MAAGDACSSFCPFSSVWQVLQPPLAAPLWHVFVIYVEFWLLGQHAAAAYDAGCDDLKGTLQSLQPAQRLLPATYASGHSFGAANPKRRPRYQAELARLSSMQHRE